MKRYALALAALSACLLLDLARTTCAYSYTPVTLETGAEAPDFSLPGVDGRTYSLDYFSQSRVLVVVFTTNHCPTAQAYEQRIMDLHADFRNRGVALVAISPNDPRAVRLDELGYTDIGDSFEEMKIRARERGFGFPYLYDGETQSVARAYGPVATPHVFVFDSERRLRYNGRVDDAEKPENVETRDARLAIEALLAGGEVPVEKTKSFGCSIKWSDKRESARQALERWAAEPVTLELIGTPGIRSLVANPTDRLRLVNVWATWCGPCISEFPGLVEIYRMYRNRDFEMVTISADLPSKREKALEFLEKQDCSAVNYLFDSEDKYELIEAVDSEWPGSIPHTMLVAPGGEVIYRYTGQVDMLELKQAIVGYLGRYYE